MKNFLKFKRIVFKKVCLTKKVNVSTIYITQALIRFFLLAFNKNFFFWNYVHFYVFNNLFAIKLVKLNFFFYFIMNFSRLQEFFSFVYTNFILFKSFSAGLLLKFFSAFVKKNRRNVQKHRAAIFFLKNFFLRNLRAGAEAWLYGFKKKYLPVVLEVASWGVVQEFVWCLRKSTGAFRFRRVIAIKKRIRKHINS